MNARTSRVLQCLPGTFNIRAAGARQTRNNGPANNLSDRSHRFKIAVRGNRKSSLDDVDAQAIKLVRQAQLLLVIHAAARRLLSVAEGGIENRNLRST